MSLALLVQAQLLTGHFGPAAADDGGGSDESRRILICTGAGLKWITLNGEGEPDPSRGGAATKCPLCTHLTTIHLAATAAPPTHPVPNVIAAPQRPRAQYDVPASLRLSPAHLPRGPPVV